MESLPSMSALLPALSSIAAAAAWLLPAGIIAWFALRFVRAYERRIDSADETRILKERMLRLEKRLNELGDDVRGIAEAQRFTSRRLMERETRVAGTVIPPIAERTTQPGSGIQPHVD